MCVCVCVCVCVLQERARPEFEQRIKRYIRKCKDDNARLKFFVYNPVLEKKEYIQPAHWFWPKVIATFSILISMVRPAINTAGACVCTVRSSSRFNAASIQI